MKSKKINQNKSHGFFQDVFDVVRQIPKGRVTSYGAIAKYLGTGTSARLVGWAMNASHHSIEPVPAQRVVNRNGMLTGKLHFSDFKEMERLLKLDGLDVEKDQVKNFKDLFWDPATEIAI